MEPVTRDQAPVGLTLCCATRGGGCRYKADVGETDAPLEITSQRRLYNTMDVFGNYQTN